MEEMEEKKEGKASRFWRSLYTPRLNTMVVTFMSKSVDARLNTMVVAFVSKSVKTVL